jgi:response regulator RpfG family c-di-GMP phosphodiesterase
MVTFKEMIGDITVADIPMKHQQNIQEFLKKINPIRLEDGHPWIVTNGYRTWQDHVRIYNQKGIFDLSKIPKKSNHLIGRAIDIYDPDLRLTKWLKENNSERMIKYNVYGEEGNSNWLHLQDVAPASGRRWFYP